MATRIRASCRRTEPDPYAQMRGGLLLTSEPFRLGLARPGDEHSP